MPSGLDLRYTVVIRGHFQRAPSTSVKRDGRLNVFWGVQSGRGPVLDRSEHPPLYRCIKHNSDQCVLERSSTNIL
jgi:hypothetical protein